MPRITEEDVAATHLRVMGHLPDWVTVAKLNGAGRQCSVCGLNAGSYPSWSLHPKWRAR